MATNTDDVCSSGHPASDFDGAVIYINDKEYYATTWSKESIYIGRKTDMLKAGRYNNEEKKMSNIIKELCELGRSDAWISKHLGMDKDEILRLKQITGLTAMFKEVEFGNAWLPADDSENELDPELPLLP